MSVCSMLTDYMLSMNYLIEFTQPNEVGTFLSI